MHDLFLYRNNVFKCLKQKEREKKLFDYSEVVMVSSYIYMHLFLKITLSSAKSC